ncbi:MAG: efflux RND transporter permease subunit, partial [Planctomycetota bacterium]
MTPSLSDNGSGLIGWFVRNPVAANLLMLMILAGGALTLWSTRKEVFPDFDIGMVTVRVPYLGASPEEVEEAVCIRVEEAILGVDGIKTIRSTAAEGVGTVIAELEDDADENKALNDI